MEISCMMFDCDAVDFNATTIGEVIPINGSEYKLMKIVPLEPGSIICSDMFILPLMDGDRFLFHFEICGDKIYLYRLHTKSKKLNKLMDAIHAYTMHARSVTTQVHHDSDKFLVELKNASSGWYLYRPHNIKIKHGGRWIHVTNVFIPFRLKSIIPDGNPPSMNYYQFILQEQFKIEPNGIRVKDFHDDKRYSMYSDLIVSEEELELILTHENPLVRHSNIVYTES